MSPDNLYYFQMSDLHIVLIDCCFHGRSAQVGNALVGREAFSHSSNEPQCESVRLEDGRTLHVTHMSFCSLFTLSKAYRETGRTDFPFKDQDAVVLVARITPDLTLDYCSFPTYDTERDLWRGFFQKERHRCSVR